MKMINFLYLGNLIPEKGVVVLIEACERLKNRGFQFQCHIVGASSRELSVEDCMKLVDEKDLSDYVKVHGPLYGSDKEKMLQTCDCFVFPTYYHNECFPLVILEAMQHSLPVIATPVGAIPDMVIEGETGRLVPVRKSEALEQAMMEMLPNRQNTRYLGAKGYSRYEEMYTHAVFNNVLLSILNE